MIWNPRSFPVCMQDSLRTAIRRSGAMQPSAGRGDGENSPCVKTVSQIDNPAPFVNILSYDPDHRAALMQRHEEGHKIHEGETG